MNDFNIDYIVNNTKILTEFTKLAEQIKELVKNLPDNKEYSSAKENIKDLQRKSDEIYKMFYDYVQASKLSDERIKLIKDRTQLLETIFTEITDVKESLRKVFIWMKVKFPLIAGAISLIIFAVGFFVWIKGCDIITPPSLPTIIP